MEGLSKPFLAQDKSQAFNAICNVLIKKNKLFIGEHTLSPEHERTVRQQFKQFKNKCHQMMQNGESVFASAMHCFMLCQAYLTEFTAANGYDDYNCYLEGLWLKNQLMEWENYDGVKRLKHLKHLIDNQGKGFTSCDLFRETEADSQGKVALRSDNSINLGGPASACTNAPTAGLSERQKEGYWQLCNPVDLASIIDEAIFVGELSIENEPNAIEKFDDTYISQMLKERGRLLKKEGTGEITEEEKRHLGILRQFISEAMGWKPKGKSKFGRARFFKSPENIKSYACVKMSMMRSISIFPEGSPERELINKYFRFDNGKFYWKI
ncbi:MAG: hypothetical protein PHY48_13220 [Candidatus Cloacimonetes bacterium]|nr:hypothetical protein [Candidatus Cloacimonadota bacterium]